MSRPPCLCGRDEPIQEGDTVRLGDVLSSGIEPGERLGRVVGFLRPHVPGMKIVIRCFRPGDGRWPTGEYRRTGMPHVWHHQHPTTEVPSS